MNKREKKTLVRVREYLKVLPIALDAFVYKDSGLSEISKAEITTQELDDVRAAYLRSLVLLDEVLYNFGDTPLSI